MAGLHYASGGGIASSGEFEAGAAGFNLADVQSVEQLNALPDGVKGLVWLDQGDGATAAFKDAVRPYIGNPDLYGFYLVDEPDPTGRYGELVTAEDLKAESDWIHANVPGAKTFITMMDMGSSENPSFANSYNPENTGIDLFGLDPYPVRSEASEIDFDMIDRTVEAAVEAGIPLEQIVPVYQAFGGGGWVNDNGGSYVLPTPEEQEQLIDRWAEVTPNPAFDYAYSWNSQNGDTALENSPELQSVFLRHNTSDTASVPVQEPAQEPAEETVDEEVIQEAAAPVVDPAPPAVEADPVLTPVSSPGLDFAHVLDLEEDSGSTHASCGRSTPVAPVAALVLEEINHREVYVICGTGQPHNHHHNNPHNHAHHAWD